MKHEMYFFAFLPLEEYFKVHRFNVPCKMEQASIEMVSTIYIEADMEIIRESDHHLCISSFFIKQIIRKHCCLKMVFLGSNINK